VEKGSRTWRNVKKSSKRKRDYSEREKKVSIDGKKGHKKETFGQNTLTLFVTEYQFFIALIGATECICQLADESVVEQQGRVGDALGTPKVPALNLSSNIA
jgi:hypothetical protein